MALGRWPVHGPSHTLLGVLALSIVGALVGKSTCAWLYPRLRRWMASPDAATKRFLTELDAPSPAGTWVGALLGGASHLVLDAVIHGDLQPLAPWSVANPLLVEGSFVWMHAGCAAAAAVGFVWWAVRRRG